MVQGQGEWSFAFLLIFIIICSYTSKNPQRRIGFQEQDLSVSLCLSVSVSFCLSLLICLSLLWRYRRGGEKRFGYKIECIVKTTIYRHLHSRYYHDEYVRGISQVSQDGGDLSTPSTTWFLLNFHPSIPLTILFFIHLNCKRKKRKTTGTIFLILRGVGGWGGGCMDGSGEE